MEIYHLNKDIVVYCETAKSFPDGIRAAHERLHAHLSRDKRRRFFGISFGMKNGSIIYKAAVEEIEKGELEKHGLEKFIIKKGTYISKIIPDFVNNIPAIGKTFRELLADPRVDPQGACIEDYYSDQKDLRCMVRLDPNKI